MRGWTVNRRKWQTLLALFAIYLQVLAPLTLTASTAQATTDGFPTYGVICTAYGAKVINLSTGEEVPTHVDYSEKCPLCLFFHAQAATVNNASEFKFAPPAKIGERLISPKSLGSKQTAVPSDCLSRSPPIVL